jgi:hypothetical protein
VWTHSIIVTSPALGRDFTLLQRIKDFPVQQFVASLRRVDPLRAITLTSTTSFGWLGDSNAEFVRGEARASCCSLQQDRQFWSLYCHWIGSERESEMHLPIRYSSVALLAFTLLVATALHAEEKSYTYETDPPVGSVPCGKTVTVKSSKQCGGKPATIVGGCNRDGTRAGAKRKLKCG